VGKVIAFACLCLVLLSSDLPWRPVWEAYDSQPTAQVPHLITGQALEYPISLRKAGVEGKVGIRVQVSAQGVVKSSVLVSSSGNQILDTYVVTKASDLRFTTSSASHVLPLSVVFKLAPL